MMSVGVAPSEGILDSLAQLFGVEHRSVLIEASRTFHCSSFECSLEIFIPKLDDVELVGSYIRNAKQFVFVNQRPIDFPKAIKLVSLGLNFSRLLRFLMI